MEKKTLSLGLGSRAITPNSRTINYPRSGGPVIIEQRKARGAAAKSKPDTSAPVETDTAPEKNPPAGNSAFERKERELRAIQQEKLRQEAERRSLAERKERERLERARKETEAERRVAARRNSSARAEQPVEEIAESKSAESRKSERKRTKDRTAQTQRPSQPRMAGQRRRGGGKLTVGKAILADEERQRSHASYRRSQERKKRKAEVTSAPREKVVREVQVPEMIVVQELANRMAERVSDVIVTLMKNGVMATQNQPIDGDTAELIIGEFGHTAVRVSDADVEDVLVSEADAPDDLQPKPPVITVMGHVDHGKTSLLDTIRRTNVAAGEDGGITQHIGAYQVETEDGRILTFLDTPGHAAFTSMRARGAQVTDIIVLVVAADDAVMPQTIEAINHARAAAVPMIVAINKCDLPGADPEHVRNELLRHEIVVEKRSGTVLDVEVSAANGEGIGDLLEALSLQAELLELKANPARIAEGAVIEAQLDTGRGPVATILVRNGTLRIGDVFVVGEQSGRVRALLDQNGTAVSSAGPATPVKVLGLNGTPQAGDILNVVEAERQAQEISDYRRNLAKSKRSAHGNSVAIEKFLQLRDGSDDTTMDLPVVVKTDVQGSAEAIMQALEKIGNEEVRVRVMHAGVGAITENDINLAAASNAVVVGFNARANASAREAAMRRSIKLHYHSVIYNLVDEIKDMASGLLSAEIRETIIGNAEILQIFKVTGSGIVAGCRVTDGTVRRACGVRLLRDHIVVHEGRLKTLKRFKDEVNEVQTGQECGMAFENYSSIRPGDIIEVFERQEIERSL